MVLEFHLADAPGEAESDGTAAPGVAVVGLILIKLKTKAIFFTTGCFAVENRDEEGTSWRTTKRVSSFM